MFLTLNINGEFIDLEENFKISFKKNNPVFQLNNIILERSTSFTIPPTNHNLRVLGLSNRADQYGQEARITYTAQLVANAVVMNGKLNIIKVDKKGYFSAVFVVANQKLLDLKGAKINATSPSRNDLFKRPPYGYSYYKYAPTSFQPEQVTDKRIFIHPYYKSVNSRNRTLFPSINLWYLANKEIEAIFGIKVKGIENDLIFQTVPNSLPAIKKVEGYISSYISGDRKTWYQSFQFGNLSLDSQIIAVKMRDVETNSNIGSLSWGGTVFPQAVKISFPLSLSDNYFLVSVPNTEDIYTKISDIQFFGDYSFSMELDGTLIPKGESLGGREVEVPANLPIFLINKNFYKTEYLGTGFELGFSIDINDYPRGEDISGITLEAKEKEIPYPSGTGIMRLGDILPKYSYIDLLFIFSWLTGKYFEVSEDTITFHTVSPVKETARRIDLTQRLLGIEEVKRQLLDFGQNNYLKFDANAGTPTRVLVGSSENEYLKPVNDIITLGGSLGNNGTVYDAFYNEKARSWQAAGLSYGTFCNAGEPNELRTSLIWGSASYNSTKVKASVYYSLRETQELEPQDLIIINGVGYFWTSYVWNEDVLTLELAKV